MTAENTDVEAGRTPERVGFFTDAVFAIAMTLLVIEIPRPEEAPEFSVGDGVSKTQAAGHLWHFLTGQTGSFVAYLLAFFMLWTAWRQHHTLFDRIGRLSPGLVAWHFPLLLLIGFLPYPATVYGHHTANPAAALLFVLTVGGLLICRAGVQSQALRDDLLHAHVDASEVAAGARASWIVAAYWLVTIVLCWWTPWVIIAWTLTPVLGAILNRGSRRRRTSIGSS
ncbi:TMEM175 family protein [Actinoplanes friuliensis]|uniref:DUF1211 domain-containing protein n=1 Tax=Actinoplanes friuliensis DSM 7358 TaxID=1246995 RepID=U5W6A4_9ACTN|nr:TMEM175 family protein [Actinoplanes friuliensis]AGZ43481.1 hypothetical protein AFR_26085 [Actinoplanes friuliensis DSM 7358]